MLVLSRKVSEDVVVDDDLVIKTHSLQRRKITLEVVSRTGKFVGFSKRFYFRGLTVGKQLSFHSLSDYNVIVTFLGTSGTQVRLGFEAPKNIKILLDVHLLKRVTKNFGRPFMIIKV